MSFVAASTARMINEDKVSGPLLCTPFTGLFLAGIRLLVVDADRWSMSEFRKNMYLSHDLTIVAEVTSSRPAPITCFPEPLK